MSSTGKTESAEIKFLLSLKGCLREGRTQSQETREKVQINPVHENANTYNIKTAQNQGYY
jgi:hypothetical protein